MIGRIPRGGKVGIVCCSNGQSGAARQDLDALAHALRNMGLTPVWSDYIYARRGAFSGTAQERAEALMGFYQDPAIRGIFDISGGDIANEILDRLDFSLISGSDKQFWGYSDLTTVLNAIYTQTGKTSVLYQIRHLLGDHGRQRDLSSALFDGSPALTDISFRFVQGNILEGVVVGGNIRCFLKLAGTPYFPNLEGKVLLLEAYGGTEPQMTTYLSQLRQMGAFERISGILLGTFTKLEEAGGAMEDILLRHIPPHLPVGKTPDIGHATTAKAMVIGAPISLKAR